MSTAKNTGELPLRFAAKLTRMANASYESGEMADRVTPVTRDLLRFWFSDTFTETRKFNFHDGQKQAILNTLFAHEVLKSKSVFDMYALADSDALAEMGTGEIAQKKYACSKYCIKMATGTGKTWVMHALLLWQYLNAKYAAADGAPPECVFSKNFLLVAPGLIVYERLLDAFLGKETDDGTRSFETSDYHVFRELFIPDGYKNAAFGFIQNAVAKKDEIGKKVTGDGVIAVTNWHLLAGDGSETETADSSDPAAIVKDLLPVTPGTTAGHSLSSLDSKFFSGAERDCLARLPDLVVINDEAHHIHETKTEGYADEVEWQKSLTVIAQGKGEKFIQVDFSATPYSETGNGQKRVKQYFPHIVVDFDLKTAIHKGLVKTIVLDKRKELASEQLADLDFRAERDEDGRPVALSEGQKIMLRAGLAKLRILETQFAALSPGTDKCPKMLAICEDTAVSPLVIAYLTQFEGLADEDVVQIDSDKKGSIPAPEWQSIKRTLFSVDRHKTPKVIVSVLMLREGFDVNNICVIVPLRRSQSDHLLEQIVGRGLRLMWRGEEYESIKAENRERLLVKKQEPSNYFDILSIVEHPAFIEFYNDLIKEGMIGEAGELKNNRSSVLGDLIEITLKENYREYDLFFPVIVQDKEEFLADSEIPIDDLLPFTAFPLEKLKRFAQAVGDTFVSSEITVGTQFGRYKVNEAVFNAKSYNEFISRIVGVLSVAIEKTGRRKAEIFPFMQVHAAKLAAAIDSYIRTRLFNGAFDPFIDENWRVLLVRDADSCVVNHVVAEMSKLLCKMQQNTVSQNAVVRKYYFSEISKMKIREKFRIRVAKSIFDWLPYPSNKGIFERDFMQFLDSDAAVERFIKIRENIHDFAYVSYLRADGMISRYFPDFLVKIKKDVYLAETKSQKDTDNANVLSKKRAALDWIRQINDLPVAERTDSVWHYCLVSDALFYQFQKNGASAKDIFDFSQIRKADVVRGELVFDE